MKKLFVGLILLHFALLVYCYPVADEKVEVGERFGLGLGLAGNVAHHVGHKVVDAIFGADDHHHGRQHYGGGHGHGGGYVAITEEEDIMAVAEIMEVIMEDLHMVDIMEDPHMVDIMEDLLMAEHLTMVAIKVVMEDQLVVVDLVDRQLMQAHNHLTLADIMVVDLVDQLQMLAHNHSIRAAITEVDLVDQLQMLAHNHLTLVVMVVE
jgi:hypothetical protein